MTLAMLPSNAEPADLSRVFSDDPNWVVSRKLDGDRVLAGNVAGSATFWNREGAGYTKRVPLGVREFVATLPEGLVVDGELVDGRWHIFDVVVDGSVLAARLQAVAQIGVLAELDHAPVEVVAHHSVGREDHVAAWLADGAEGFVAKRLDSVYRGGRTKAWLKVKFTSTVDCLVLPGPGCEKDHLHVGLLADGIPAGHECTRACQARGLGGRGFHEVGRVSSLTGDGPLCKPGDVVTVTVLDVSDAHRLVQPVRPLLRPGDVQPHACTWEQLDACRRQR